ncbi:hypothetical protein [Schlesneria sp. DSM 10557]|uniref:hypothetical protein n=1 Tax=Schlesneria sp. DSM 10557 TaxID=3044399 RepID=UPI00359F4D9A
MGAIASLTCFMLGRNAWSLVATHLGVLGGTLCAAILAVLLTGGNSSEPALVTLPKFTWLTVPNPRQFSLEFGAEATLIKALLVTLIGGGILLTAWSISLRKCPPLPENVQVTCSLLFASTMGFLFSPNLPQSLLSWGVVSLLLSVLIRILSGPAVSSSPGKTTARLRGLTHGLQWIGEKLCKPVGRGAMISLPNWISEQFEVIEASPISVQLLAVVLGAAAVLLTWLIVI